MSLANTIRRFLGSSYVGDIGWLASGTIVAQCIGVLAMPVLTRLYPPGDFALQNLFLQVTSFAVVLLTWRYEYFVQLAKDDADAANLTFLVLCLGICGAAIATPVIWLFQETLADWLGAPSLARWLIFVPVTASLMCLAIAMQNFAQRQGQFRHASFSELASKGSYVGTALVGYWIFPLPAGLILASAGSAIGRAIWLLGSWGGSKSGSGGFLSYVQIPLNGTTFSSLRRIARTYRHLAGSMIISHLLMSITTVIPSIFIARMYGTETLGQFALAAATIYLPSGLVANAIGQVYYQRAAASWSAGGNFVALWRVTAKFLIMVGLPTYAFLILVSPWVYPLVFGPQWVDAGKYASLMAISAFFSFISTPFDRACLVVGAWKYIPIWHSARALSTGFVALLSWFNDWDMQYFVIALVLQMTVMYLIDYWAEYRFALLHGPGGAECE